MAILNDTAHHGRDYKNDIRELTGTNSISLPDDSLFLDIDGPWCIEAENWVLNVLDSRNATPPAETDDPEYKYLYFACLYRLACIIWPELLAAHIIVEKSPDYEFRKDGKRFDLLRDEICGKVETWFDLLGAPKQLGVVIDVVRGDSRAEYQDRPNGV